MRLSTTACGFYSCSYALKQFECVNKSNTGPKTVKALVITSMAYSAYNMLSLHTDKSPSVRQVLGVVCTYVYYNIRIAIARSLDAFKEKPGSQLAGMGGIVFSWDSYLLVSLSLHSTIHLLPILE